MCAEPDSKPLKRQPVCRWMGVVVCLLALTVALFGHIEAPEAALAATDHPVISLADGETSSDHKDYSIFHHCVHHGQCSFHAVLPAAVSIAALEATEQTLSGSPVGESLAISPLRHPPKTRVVA